jgi:hypothetical protein
MHSYTLKACLLMTGLIANQHKVSNSEMRSDESTLPECPQVVRSKETSANHSQAVTPRLNLPFFLASRPPCLGHQATNVATHGHDDWTMSHYHVFSPLQCLGFLTSSLPSFLWSRIIHQQVQPHVVIRLWRLNTSYHASILHNQLVAP